MSTFGDAQECLAAGWRGPSSSCWPGGGSPGWGQPCRCRAPSCAWPTSAEQTTERAAWAPIRCVRDHDDVDDVLFSSDEAIGDGDIVARTLLCTCYCSDMSSDDMHPSWGTTSHQNGVQLQQ